MPDVAPADRVPALMPALRADLERLVAIPSVSAPGHPAATHPPLAEAFALLTELFAAAGVQELGALELPGTAPVLTGSIPAPPGAPTVLLYSHYDVVGPGDEALWSSPPFVPTERDGALYGRGTADSKANIVAHLGALRAWEGRPPVGIRLVIEGSEEVGGGALTTYPPTDPARFAADAMLIGDAGPVRPGVPALTVALRGVAQMIVEVRTLAGAKHSGEFGGAAPDALLVLLHALATLHDEAGDVAVAGLRREPWTGGGFTEEEFRALAEVEDGLPLLGTGDLGSRVWSGPAITVIGIDVPPVDRALNAVAPFARAKLNVRVHPEQDAAEAGAAVAAHLEGLRPFGVPVRAWPTDTGMGFATPTSGPAYAAMAEAMADAWSVVPVHAASGGSIPLVSALQAAAPGAEILLVGACDGYANIHAPDERVLLDELERAVVSEARFFAGYAERFG